MILELDQGATAWLLTSAALVLVMTPGVAFFYGGMVRAKGVLNMMMMSFIAMGTVGVLWVFYGYSMAFGTDLFGGLLGNPLEHAGLYDLLLNDGTAGEDGSAYPALAFVGFQAGFAIITVALISGAIADRVKFGAWTVFTVIWATLVYFPIAHWVWAADGWAFKLGVIDFAGGTAIHINAGAAALALALVIGPRIGFGTKPMRPHNMTLVMLGAALLWFGWFGFNAGSAVAADGRASLAWVNTLVATSAAMLAWLIVEKLRDGHATSLGAASGVVAGLVAITPAAGAVDPMGAIAIGAVAGVGCAFAVGLKYKWGYDDSLDVVGVHMVGGVIGTLLIGFLATPAASGDPESPSVAGVFYGGSFDQLGIQAIGAFSSMAYSFVVTLLIALAIKYTLGWRVSAAEELSGIDLAEHSEGGYDLSPVYYTNKVQRTLVLTKDDLAETGASK
ncbi:MAG: ammonia channel protein [Actinobacteria bacterium HGW-Actinobacteria-2]|nr:MAG: ammonia channel protein [Actinobacteria bacterium HGW-Actinobacteria-2]